MQTTESEVELVIKIDTGKFRAVCASVGLSADASADAVLDAVLNMARWRDNVRRAKYGFLALLFDGAEEIDNAIDWLMQRSQNRQKGK